MQKVSQMAVSIPSDLDTHTIKDKRGNTLILRDPIWADYTLIRELAKAENLDNEDRLIQMALRLAVSYNGEAGVTLTDLMQLDRFAMREVNSLMLSFQLDSVPDIDDRAKIFLQEYLSNQ